MITDTNHQSLSVQSDIALLQRLLSGSLYVRPVSQAKEGGAFRLPLAWIARAAAGEVDKRNSLRNTLLM